MSAAEKRVPACSIFEVIVGSAITFLIADASEEKRPALRATPTVSLMTASSWWASSKMTTSCGGNKAPPLAMCNPYICKFTTTTSASAPRSRAFSAKHSLPTGQFFRPGHSSLPTEVALRARSLGRWSSSSKSPVAVVRDQAMMESTSFL